MQINQIVPVSSPGQETVRGAEDAYGPVFTKWMTGTEVEMTSRRADQFRQTNRLTLLFIKRVTINSSVSVSSGITAAI